MTKTEPCANPVPAEDSMSAVLGTLNGRLSARETMLLHEIAGLARIIEQAKAEIAEVSVDEIRGSHIPPATGELDAIVEYTAVATESILEGCELLDGLAGSFDDKQAAIVQDVTTRIYEACSFQDITGQRITKVVKATEAKVLMLSGAGDQAGAAIKRIELATEPSSLLNGPMLPHER
jgi:chemotaxis protein CheZ